MLAELPYVFPLMLGSDGLPKLLHFAWVIVGLGSLVGMVGAEAGSWGLLGFSACVTVSTFTGNCGNDGVMIALVFLTYACLMLSERINTSTPGVWLAGVLIGFGVSVKYLSAVDFIFPLVAVVLQKRERRLGWWLACGASASLVGAPWIAKSWLLTGDPFFPMLSCSSIGSVGHSAAGIGNAWRSWIAHDHSFGHSMVEYVRYLAWENPSLLLVLIAAMVYRSRWIGAILLSVALCFLCFYAFPGSRVFQARWFFPLIAPAVFFSHAACARCNAGRSLKLTTGCLIVWGICNRMVAQTSQWNPVPYLVGVETRLSVQRTVFGTFEETMSALRRQPNRMHRAVLSIGEIRAYRVPLPFIPGDAPPLRYDALAPLYGPESPLLWDMVRSSSDERTLAKKLREINVDVIVHNPMRATELARLISPFRWDERMLTLLHGFLSWRTSDLIRPVHVDQRNGVFYVYSVLPTRRASPSPFLLTFPGADGLLADGQSAIANQDWVRAVSLLERVCRRYPGIGQFDDVLAYAYHLSERRDEARAIYAQGIRRGMVDDINIIDAACEAYESGRFGDAAELFSRAANVYPDLSRKVLLFLHGVRLSAISQHIAAGDGVGVSGLVSAWLQDRRADPFLDPTLREARSAELHMALIVSLDQAGRGDSVRTEIASFQRTYPNYRMLPMAELRKFILSNAKTVKGARIGL
ncbi:MAG: hypothetical protein AAB152_12310 [Candidatus Coatesbacteria bacterium]